jgi:hypothetical protein
MNETVEIFQLNLFGLDAYLIQPEENKKSHNLLPNLYNPLKNLYLFTTSQFHWRDKYPAGMWPLTG